VAEPVPILDVCNVEVRFGSLVALSEVSLSVPPDSIVGLIGPNGAGKSTLVSVISGHIRPGTGSVRFLGENVTAMSPARRARRGLTRTFQALELFDDSTVEENVLVGAGHGQGETPSARSSGALGRTGLTDIRWRLTRSLAAPVRQTVSYARAIAAQPRCLVFDEPAAGLAEQGRRVLVDRIRADAASSDMSVLVIEHDMRFVRQVCDSVVFLNAGVVIASGSPHEVLSSQVVKDAYLGTSGSSRAGGLGGPG
jgi:ABC-type branched-subunit amino acid transport system ATPase component